MSQSEAFFQLLPDFDRLQDQWFLDDPRAADDAEIDAREFTEGRRYVGPRPVRVAPGEAEFFPVEVEGAQGQYSILNAICRAECLDESRSEFTMWTEADDNPEMLGNYRTISEIVIDPARTEGHHLFRIARWTLALLVSGTLKDAIEDIPNLGVVFESVV